MFHNCDSEIIWSLKWNAVLSLLRVKTTIKLNYNGWGSAMSTEELLLDITKTLNWKRLLSFKETWFKPTLLIPSSNNIALKFPFNQEPGTFETRLSGTEMPLKSFRQIQHWSCRISFGYHSTSKVTILN